jgi:hypothetical protein
MTYDEMTKNGYIYYLNIRYKKRIDTNSDYDLCKPFKTIKRAIQFITPILAENTIDEAILVHIKKHLIIKHWISNILIHDSK